MYRLFFSTFFLVLIAVNGNCQEIRLAAAASMSDCVKEMITVFQGTGAEDKIVSQFASSGNLAKQILHGAPVDIYISANRKWMDYLLQKGKIRDDSQIILARNRLVFVSSSSMAVTGFDDLDKLRLIAMGSPRSVPAGMYAAQALEKAGMYQVLQNKRKIVIAKDVRQALRYAELQEVGGAFVYLTDAKTSTKVTIQFMVDQGMHDPILYPAGVTGRGAKNDAALRFMKFLKGTEAQRILLHYGFETTKIRK